MINAEETHTAIWVNWENFTSSCNVASQVKIWNQWVVDKFRYVSQSSLFVCNHHLIHPWMVRMLAGQCFWCASTWCQFKNVSISARSWNHKCEGRGADPSLILGSVCWSVFPLCQEGFIRVFPDVNVTELDFIYASINQVSLSPSLDYSIANH